MGTFKPRRGVASTIGTNFSSLYSFAACSLANIIMIGQGSISILRPRKLFKTPSVQATCADLIQTTLNTSGSSSASCIPTTQGVMSGLYRPGMALALALIPLCFLDHSVIVSFSAGFRVLAILAIRLDVAVFVSR